MLKFLTSKFRSQSLNEVRPYEPQGFLHQETDIENTERDDDDDDEELRSLNLEGTPIPLHNNNNHEPDDVNIVNSKATTANIKESPLSDQENQPPFNPLDTKRTIETTTATFFPIDIPNTQGDCTLLAEKRKWSQVNCKRLLHQMGSGTDSSSDEEIKELCSSSSKCGLLSSSPPGKVTVLSKHSAFCAQVRPTDKHIRKKHRVILCDERPSLNFEKMQQKTLSKKHSHSLSRPRAIRIRNLSQSNTRHPYNYDQALLVFKPIAVTPSFNLAPVEEPGFAF